MPLMLLVRTKKLLQSSILTEVTDVKTALRLQEIDYRVLATGTCIQNLFLNLFNTSF